MKRLAATVTLLAILALATSAPAQPAAHDPAAAEAAFAEALVLLQQGKIAEACPRLEASYTLEPAVGTLLNLGSCFEKQGRTASAWLRYREAAAMAVQQNQREREAIARARVAALEPKLCRLAITPSSQPDVTVKRDGLPVAPAALGLPVPIDPGPHRVEATAPGAATFATTVAVEPGAEACPTRTVEIPALTSARTVDVAPLPKPSYWRPIHTAALVTATAGVVVVVLGSAFGLQAASMKSDADAACTSAGCSAEGKSLLHDAGQRADVATVTLVIGAALLTTSAVLWLVSPSLRPSPVATTAGLRF